MRRAIFTLALPLVALGATQLTSHTRVEVERYANGQIKRRAEFRGDKLEGIAEGFYDSGARMYVYHHKAGVREGVQQQWLETGQLLAEFNYVDGHESGQQRMWNDDGTIRSNYVIKEGKRYGLVGAMGCTGVNGLPFYKNESMDPEWLDAIDAESPAMHRVAGFEMVDQLRSTLTDTVLQGRVTLVQFFFTKCADICPTTTAHVAQVLRAAGDDPRVQILSISISPDRDSVGALAGFAKARGITDPRWHLLSGARAEVEKLARESFFIGLGDGKSYGVASVQHTETLFLVDGQRRIRGVYAGTLALEVPRIVEDIRLLLR
jgi:protein SCO1